MLVIPSDLGDKPDNDGGEIEKPAGAPRTRERLGCGTTHDAPGIDNNNQTIGIIHRAGKSVTVDPIPNRHHL